jgi:hypothetical protein
MTEVFLGRLVRQGHAKPSTGDALILMGDWCGSWVRHRSTETPGLLIITPLRGTAIDSSR